MLTDMYSDLKQVSIVEADNGYLLRIITPMGKEMFEQMLQKFPKVFSEIKKADKNADLGLDADDKDEVVVEPPKGFFVFYNIKELIEFLNAYYS